MRNNASRTTSQKGDEKIKCSNFTFSPSIMCYRIIIHNIVLNISIKLSLRIHKALLYESHSHFEILVILGFLFFESKDITSIEKCQ